MSAQTTIVAVADVQSKSVSFAGLYLRFCSSNLAQLGECIGRQDREAVNSIGRILSANAYRVGLSELGSLGHQLEQYCAGPDWNAINSIYYEIAAVVEGLCTGQPLRVQVELQAQIPSQKVTVVASG